MEVAQQNIYDKRTSEFYSHSEEELKNIQLEYNSWLLISKLHEIHTNEENKDNFLQLKNKKNSENSDKRNERNRTILNWLENIYSSKLENRKTHLYTTPPNKDNLITPIQPPHSSSSSYPYDRYDEQELQLIWDSIRSGNFHTINQIASARNEYWRSSSLLGSSFVDLQFDSQRIYFFSFLRLLFSFPNLFFLRFEEFNWRGTPLGSILLIFTLQKMKREPVGMETRTGTCGNTVVGSYPISLIAINLKLLFMLPSVVI